MVNNLTVVSSNDNAGTSITSSISFAAQANTVYYIAVDGAGGVVGSIVLNWASNVVAPAVTSFDPASGGSGTAVTLTGTSFTSATAVAFNGAPAPFGIVSDTQITTTVPAEPDRLDLRDEHQRDRCEQLRVQRVRRAWE